MPKVTVDPVSIVRLSVSPSLAMITTIKVVILALQSPFLCVKTTEFNVSVKKEKHHIMYQQHIATYSTHRCFTARHQQRHCLRVHNLS